MNFWAKAFQSEPINPPVTPTYGKVWWQNDAPTPPPTMHNTVSAPSYGGHDIKALKKKRAVDLTVEEAEAVAEYDLAQSRKHHNECPQCGSGNITEMQHRMGTVTRCFDCGYAPRSPEPVVGASSGNGQSSATRQIDTGGAGGSMYMRMQGVPASYQPKS